MAGLLLQSTGGSACSGVSPAAPSGGSPHKKPSREKVRYWCSSSALQFPKCFSGHFLLCLLIRSHEIEEYGQFAEFKGPGGSKLFLFQLRTVPHFLPSIALFKLMHLQRAHC